MRFVEKTILKLLIAEAERSAFELIRVACSPATGQDDDEINLGWANAENNIAKPGALALEKVIEHMDAWDTFFCLDFQNIARTGGFWVLWVPSNGEDVISDYLSTTEANEIMKRVEDEIES